MNAADTIRAAIERLEVQRLAAFPGPWTALHSGPAHGDHSYVTADDEAIVSISANDGTDEEFRAPTADLIVTLHRTIDPQLDLLRLAAGYYGARITGPESSTTFAELGLALACAILGEDTDG